MNYKYLVIEEFLQFCEKFPDYSVAEVIFTIPSQNMQDGELLFDICDSNESELSENVSNLEVIVILTDGSGQTASLSTGDYETVYPALPVRLGKVLTVADVAICQSRRICRRCTPAILTEQCVLSTVGR